MTSALAALVEEFLYGGAALWWICVGDPVELDLDVSEFDDEAA